MRSPVSCVPLPGSARASGPGRRRAVRLSLLALTTLATVPATAGAATPFEIAPAAQGQTVVTLPAGTSYVAYMRPASVNPDWVSVGVCRVLPGASSCASNVELPFPGPTGSGPEPVGRAHVAYNATGGISVYANCFFCAGDTSSNGHAIVWTSTDGVSFSRTTLNGTTIFDGDGTGALITATVSGSPQGAFVQASSGSGAGRGVVQPLVPGPLPSPVDLSSAYLGYRSSVVRGVGNSLVYATSDGDRIRTRSFVPFGGPTANPPVADIAWAPNWSPLTAVTSPEPDGVDTLTLARTAGDVYLGYRHRQDGVSSLLYRRFDWTSGVQRFGPAMPLHPISGLDADTDEPAIAGDPSGRVHAIWQAYGGDTRRLRYAVTDGAGNAPTVLGNLATGEWFFDTQLDAGNGTSGLATWRGGGGGMNTLRAVSLDPQPEPQPAGPVDPGGGAPGGSGDGVVVTPSPVKRKQPSKEVRTSVGVPGGTLSLGAPRGCVKPKGTYTVRMSFVAKKRGSRRGNVVVKVTRADFYVDGKRRVSDRKAPFAARLKVTSKKGRSIKVRGVARLKVKKTSKPRTRSIKTTIKVCR